MGDETVIHTKLSAKAAYKTYEKLKERLARFSLFNDQFAILLDPVIQLLDFFLIEESDDGDSNAKLPSTNDVRLSFSDHLVEPDE